MGYDIKWGVCERVWVSRWTVRPGCETMPVGPGPAAPPRSSPVMQLDSHFKNSFGNVKEYNLENLK